MQNQEKIIQVIAAYMENIEELELPKHKVCIPEIATEIAAAIAPHLEAGIKKCGSCGVNESRLLHACPYREELYNDEETPCDCCFECTGQCKDRV